METLKFDGIFVWFFKRFRGEYSQVQGEFAAILKGFRENILLKTFFQKGFWSSNWREFWEYSLCWFCFILMFFFISSKDKVSEKKRKNLQHFVLSLKTKGKKSWTWIISSIQKVFTFLQWFKGANINKSSSSSSLFHRFLKLLFLARSAKWAFVYCVPSQWMVIVSLKTTKTQTSHLSHKHSQNRT